MSPSRPILFGLIFILCLILGQQIYLRVSKQYGQSIDFENLNVIDDTLTDEVPLPPPPLEDKLDVEMHVSGLIMFQVRKRCEKEEEVKILMMGISTGQGFYTLADEILRAGISLPRDKSLSPLKEEFSESCHIVLHGVDRKWENLNIAHRRIETFPTRISLELFHMKQMDDGVSKEWYIASYNPDKENLAYVLMKNHEHEYDVFYALHPHGVVTKAKLLQHTSMLREGGALILCIRKPNLVESAIEKLEFPRFSARRVLEMFREIGMHSTLQLEGIEDIECMYGEKGLVQ